MSKSSESGITTPFLLSNISSTNHMLPGESQQDFTVRIARLRERAQQRRAPMSDPIAYVRSGLNQGIQTMNQRINAVGNFISNLTPRNLHGVNSQSLFPTPCQTTFSRQQQPRVSFSNVSYSTLVQQPVNTAAP